MLCSIDLFIDWVNPSELTGDFINIFEEPYRIPVGSRIFLVNPVAGVKFKLVL